MVNRFGTDRSHSYTVTDKEKLQLTSLETITDALLEMMEACMKDIPDCDWLQTWTGLAKSFAFQYNPALQPRALIVFGCISKLLGSSAWVVVVIFDKFLMKDYPYFSCSVVCL